MVVYVNYVQLACAHCSEACHRESIDTERMEKLKEAQPIISALEGCTLILSRSSTN